MRRRYGLLYRIGLTPWDSAAISPVLVALAARGGANRIAVDLGCGRGKQARYLAGQGWSVTAVDYVAEAIRAAEREDPGATVTWRVADVTDASAVDPDGGLAGATGLILDNGCLHGVPEQRRDGWAATVTHLAADGCALAIRAAPARSGRGGWAIGPRGIASAEIDGLLGSAWRREGTSERGWYVYERRAPFLRAIAERVERRLGEDTP